MIEWKVRRILRRPLPKSAFPHLQWGVFESSYAHSHKRRKSFGLRRLWLNRYLVV
jgi:hypothetical protein